MNKFVKFCLRTFFTLFKSRCKIRFDMEKLPKKGVYVSNHVSYLDPLLLYAFLPGNPVFALNGHLHRRGWIRNLMKYADTMLFNPIEPSDIKELIAKVEAAVTAKEVRPLGDRVTVSGVEPVTYDIEIKYYMPVAEESSVVEHVEADGGAIDKYIAWQCEKIGRAINPDRLRGEILKSVVNPIGAERVEIVSPTYQALTSTQIAQWSGKATVSHEKITDEVN